MDTVTRVIKDKPKPVLSAGLVIAIVLIIGTIAVLISLIVVGTRAQADEEKRKKKEKEEKDAADKAAKEKAEKEQAEKDAEEAAKKRQEELDKMPDELKWIGLESYCSVNQVPGLGILSSAWVDGSPGHWDNMRMVFRIESGKTLDSVMPAGWIYSPSRVTTFTLALDNPAMALGVANLLKSRFPSGLKGNVISPAWYPLQDWTLKLDGNNILLSVPSPITPTPGGLGSQQPSILFDAKNIRGNP